MIAIATNMRRIQNQIRTGIRCLHHLIVASIRTSTTNALPRRARILACTALLLSLTACTNSKFVLSPIYNRLDDQMRGEFHKLAKWNEDQIAHFESRVGTFHVWHRQEELPKYASLINTIQASIRERGQSSKADVRQWVDQAETFTRNARVCHPVNFSYDLMRTLTDDQVNFIERRFARERKKNFSKYLDATPEERRQTRVDNVVKWAGRIGFDFNNTQKRMLNKAFAQQVSLRRQYYKLADAWARELFVIARKQEDPDYEKNMRAQVNKLWTLLEDAHGEDWQANRDLWREFGYEFVKSLSHDQRIDASNWLKKLAESINGISNDEPSFKLVKQSQYGCMVGQSVSG